eukprot:c32835_g1_i1 orf=127-300(-)
MAIVVVNARNTQLEAPSIHGAHVFLQEAVSTTRQFIIAVENPQDVCSLHYLGLRDIF